MFIFMYSLYVFGFTFVLIFAVFTLNYIFTQRWICCYCSAV